VLRVEVLKKVKESIDAQLSSVVASKSGARIAENGNIVIDESLVFELNSYVIRQDGKRFLDSVAKAFATEAAIRATPKKAMEKSSLVSSGWPRNRLTRSTISAPTATPDEIESCCATLTSDVARLIRSLSRSA